MDDPQPPETGGLTRLQTATRAFAALLNFSALFVCLFLLRNFKEFTLNTSALSVSLYCISGFLILSAILFLVLVWMERRKLEAESRLVSDERTGALSNRAFERILTEEMRRAGRYHYPVTVCLVDLDDFASYVESFGPEKGDELLRHFSDFLRGTVRFSDSVGRAKQEGFLILLPHTDLIRGQKFLGRALAETQEKLDTSFSAGLTPYQAGEKQSELLARLDLAMRAARQEGKKKIRAVVPGQDTQAVLSI